ncbi:SIS domain-containing protein [bacterium]|nr:SIS domain-containing protein [bacterium]
MIKSIFRKISICLSSLLTSPVYCGKSPYSVPDGSWILFPLHVNHLCCGFIGILEYKDKTGKDRKKYADKVHASNICKIKELWLQIYQKGLRALMEGQISEREYLGGDLSLSGFMDEIIALKGIKVFEHIFKDKKAQEELRKLVTEINPFLSNEDSILDKAGSKIGSSTIEMVNNRLIKLKDSVWWLERELLANLEKVDHLIAHVKKEKDGDISKRLIREMFKINIILNNLDRLEIRGRDSAGISLMIRLPDQEGAESWETSLKDAGLYEEYEKRKVIKYFTHKAIVSQWPNLCFVFKTARELGQLGENVLFLRDEIAKDNIFSMALSQQGIYSQAIAHTRWASVGDITEVNCHPIDNSTVSNKTPTNAIQINAALNGDIDNYQEIRKRLEEEDGIHIPAYFTTDTKIIPLWIGHYVSKGHPLNEAVRLAVSDFKGSHAIIIQSDKEIDHIYLAQQGSGQAIFIGIGGDCYVASSEVYGLVEQTPYYIKLDGEKERIPGRKETQGQIFVIDTKGGVEGISACYYDGHPIPVTESSIKTAQITTRDIDRQGFPHYYLKEISQAPESVRKTMRGKAAVIKEDRERRVVFNLGEEIIPGRIKEALCAGSIRHIYLVGQGTAGVAAEGIAMLMSEYLSRASISISATKASELSGFGLDRSMTDTLVIAVTQSGTTTDTNKAIDMAKNHGAFTMAIVNRRDSDITTKVDGVFYTGDGRDIEMSVASTKAFYTQIAAGCIIGLFITQILQAMPDGYIASEVRDLMRLPNLMYRIITENRDYISSSAGPVALKKRNWSVVGSGPNKMAADEIRIKLSELCYKTLPADVVEDRKHIDLSAEPLIIVCAAGNRDVVLGDVIKDIAIFKAHQATVICIATEGEDRILGLADVILTVPTINERMAPVLNTVAGHLFGYYIARAINAEADFFRQFKVRLQKRIEILSGLDEDGPDMIYDREVRLLLKEFVKEAMHRKEEGRFECAVKPSTLCNIALACRYAIGQIPVNEMINDIGPTAAHSDPLIMLTQVTDEIIGQLSRPIDAIKHQAKTVTVGTSRLPVILSGVIFDMLPKMGFGPQDLSPSVISNLRHIQPAVKEVEGATLYHITGLDPVRGPTEDSSIRLLDRLGVAAEIPSRVEKDRTLKGTKRTVVKNAEVYVGTGLRDNAQIIIFPLMGKKEGEMYLTVFHITFLDDLSMDKKIKAMGSEKYNEIVDIVTEWDIPWDDSLLEGLSAGFLMTGTEGKIAEKIKESFLNRK